MLQLEIPQYVISALDRFIFENYQYNLPNSLLIAQRFILKYQEYGKEYGLPVINYAIEERIKQGLFD